MDRINFLFRDRGDWDSSASTSYEIRDSVRLGVSQYYATRDIASGSNTLSPDSTDANNPWDLFVAGAQGTVNINTDRAVLIGGQDLSAIEIVPTNTDQVLTYDSGTQTTAFADVTGSSTVSRLGYYRFRLLHGEGFFAEQEFPVRADRWLYITLLGDLQVSGFDQVNEAGLTTSRYLNRSLVNFPNPPVITNPENPIVRVVHGHTVQYIQDNFRNWYSRRAGADFLTAGQNGISTNLFDHLGRANIIRTSTSQVSDPRFTNVIPMPAYPRRPGVSAVGYGNEQEATFFIGDGGSTNRSASGVIYFVGDHQAVAGALATTPAAAQTEPLDPVLVPTSFNNTGNIVGVDRIRLIEGVLLFRSNINGIFAWTFIANHSADTGQHVNAAESFGLTGDPNAGAIVSSFANGTPVTSSPYVGTEAMVDFAGSTTREFPPIVIPPFIFGNDVSGRFVITGGSVRQLLFALGDIPSIIRGRPPNVILGNISRQQDVVEVVSDSTRSGVSDDPDIPVPGDLRDKSQIPNTLIRTEYSNAGVLESRVYFIGNRTLLGQGETGNGDLITVLDFSTPPQTPPDPNDAFPDDFFTEVTLPAGLRPVRMKWSAKAFHILFDDGSLWGAGINADYHLGTSTGGTNTPRSLRRVQNLPYRVVDWGYYITSHVPSSDPLNSGVTMVTRFLVQDDAPGTTNGGLYYICGTLPANSENNMGIGDPALQPSSDTEGRIIRFPTQVINSDGGTLIEVTP